VAGQEPDKYSEILAGSGFRDTGQGFNTLSLSLSHLMLYITMLVPSSKLQLFIASVVCTLHKHTPHKHHSASQSSHTRSSEDVVISDIQPELSQTYPLPPPPEERSDKLEVLTNHMLSSAASYDHVQIVE